MARKHDSIVSITGILVLLAAAILPAATPAATLQGGQKTKQKKRVTGPKRWARSIAAFEKADAARPQPQGGILFVGSSSIRGWNLRRWLPQHDAINRGFGGSQIEDSIFYAEPLILKHKPRIVVLYAGDNDIAVGKSPQRVCRDYQTLQAKIRAALPQTRLVFVAIKPSLRRWKLVGKMREANRLIRETMKGDPLQVYLDIDAPMIGPDGMPLKELFAKDGLHLSPKGYDLWTRLVRPHLEDDNWPQFRGPFATNRSSRAGIPVDWDEATGKNIAWKTAIHGRGWSSPVVYGKRIWFTTASEDGKTMSAICLDSDTGKILHDLKLFENAEPRFCHAMNSYASPTPAIEDGRVYVHFGSYGTACLDSRTGKEIWRRTNLPCNHFRGPASSPVLFRDRLFIHYDGFDLQYVVALDKKTGKTIWKVDRKIDYQTDNGDIMKAYCTPIVISIGGRLQLISPASRAALAYDPWTGKEIWRIRYKGFSATAQPLFGNGHLYINTGFSKAELYAVKTGKQEGDLTDSRVSWIVKRGIPSKSTSVLVGDLMFMVSDKGIASCLDAVSGKMVWTKRLGGQYSSSPLLVDGRIYLLSHEGKVTVIKPSRKFEAVAEFKASSGFMASPAIAGRAMIVRTKKHVIKVEPSPTSSRAP